MVAKNDVELQREYYSNTAKQYDDLHLESGGEHTFALHILSSLIDAFNVKSILDIGSGTGRAIYFLKERHPGLKIVGIEPVEKLRNVGYQKGLSPDELVDGDVLHLNFSDEEFDLVCEFGVLHHVKHPKKAVDEMLRVAKRGIFISDSNNFGQGSLLSRTVKQLINLFGLWRVFDFIKTGGRGYTITEGDGLAYSYSVFNNYNQIRKHFSKIHLLNTQGGKFNFYKTASHVALFAINKD